MKILSICVPTYNRSEYLKNFLTSLTTWKVVHIEVVISDDCSTDDTPNVVSEFSTQLNIRYIRQKNNLGAMKNAIAAFQFATGDYIISSGDDDIPVESSHKKAIDILDNDKKLVAVYGSSEYRQQGTSTILWIDAGLPANIPERINFTNVMQLFDTTYMTEISVVRRDLFQRLVFNEGNGLFFGWHTIASLLEYGEIFMVNDVLVIKFVEDTSLSFKSVQTQRNYVDDFELFFARLNLNYHKGRVPELPSLISLVKKITQCYYGGLNNSIRYHKAYLDSHCQLGKLIGWRFTINNLKQWEKQYLLSVTMTRTISLIKLFPNIKTVVFEECPLSTICEMEFRNLTQDYITQFMSNDEIVKYKQNEDEFILTELFETIEQYVQLDLSYGAQQRSLQDILNSCSYASGMCNEKISEQKTELSL